MELNSVYGGLFFSLAALTYVGYLQPPKGFDSSSPPPPPAKALTVNGDPNYDIISHHDYADASSSSSSSSADVDADADAADDRSSDSLFYDSLPVFLFFCCNSACFYMAVAGMILYVEMSLIKSGPAIDPPLHPPPRDAKISEAQKVVKPAEGEEANMASSSSSSSSSSMAMAMVRDVAEAAMGALWRVCVMCLVFAFSCAGMASASRASRPLLTAISVLGAFCIVSACAMSVILAIRAGHGGAGAVESHHPSFHGYGIRKRACSGHTNASGLLDLEAAPLELAPASSSSSIGKSGFFDILLRYYCHRHTDHVIGMEDRALAQQQTSSNITKTISITTTDMSKESANEQVNPPPTLEYHSSANASKWKLLVKSISHFGPNNNTCS